MHIEKRADVLHRFKIIPIISAGLFENKLKKKLEELFNPWYLYKPQSLYVD